MLDEGPLSNLPIEEIYALHNLPGEPVGQLSTRHGLICSSESLFEIIIEGQSCHASMPQMGKDAILISIIVRKVKTHTLYRMDDGSSLIRYRNPSFCYKLLALLLKLKHFTRSRKNSLCEHFTRSNNGSRAVFLLTSLFRHLVIDTYVS